MAAKGALLIQPLEGIPLVRPGDSLADIIFAAVGETNIRVEDGDIFVIAQKVVSKAEGRSVDLSTVTPSQRAIDLAGVTKKDARLVELILSESRDVLRVREGLIIVEHVSGVVLANAGIDRSNVGDDRVLLLPVDADQSARQIRAALREKTRVDSGVLIIDSIGREWRNGTIGTVIGSSGVVTLLNLRGRPDLFGRHLETTEVGWADELAAAASFVMGQAGEGRPVVLARGAAMAGNGATKDLIRNKSTDLFR